jgi:glutaredoxin 3
MTRILLYTTLYCGFCLAAKRLLAVKGLNSEEINVVFDPEKRTEMTSCSGGGYTVPQILIQGPHVGGYDELPALEGAGELDAWLAREPEMLAPEFLTPETSEP